MEQTNGENVQKVNRADTRRYAAQDNEGHLTGSHQAGNSLENWQKEREREEEEDNPLNKTDARGTVRGDEAI